MKRGEEACVFPFLCRTTMERAFSKEIIYDFAPCVFPLLCRTTIDDNEQRLLTRCSDEPSRSSLDGPPSGARVATAPVAGAMHSPRSYLGAVRVFSVPRDERPCVDLEGTRHATARESWCSRLLRSSIGPPVLCPLVPRAFYWRAFCQ